MVPRKADRRSGKLVILTSPDVKAKEVQGRFHQRQMPRQPRDFVQTLAPGNLRVPTPCAGSVEIGHARCPSLAGPVITMVAGAHLAAPRSHGTRIRYLLVRIATIVAAHRPMMSRPHRRHIGPAVHPVPRTFPRPHLRSGPGGLQGGTVHLPSGGAPVLLGGVHLPGRPFIAIGRGVHRVGSRVLGLHRVRLRERR